MRPKFVFAMLLCALVAFSAGCGRTQATRAAEPTEGIEDVAAGMPLAPDFRIADIPVPAGFEFSRDHSFVFQNSDMDVGRIEYIGKKVHVADVAQFYLDEMGRYNWSLLNVTEHGTILLLFDKPGKSCQVLLTPKGRGALIQITFSPKPSAAEAGL
jgi:hypothetical protein